MLITKSTLLLMLLCKALEFYTHAINHNCIIFGLCRYVRVFEAQQIKKKTFSINNNNKQHGG